MGLDKSHGHKSLTSSLTFYVNRGDNCSGGLIERVSKKIILFMSSTRHIYDVLMARERIKLGSDGGKKYTLLTPRPDFNGMGL